MNNDSTTTLLRSATSFFSGTLLSRISGLLRDVSMAVVFGTTAETAALLVAYRLANFFRRIFGEGALQSAFIPLFEEIRADSPERAFSFFRELRTKLTRFLILLVCLIMTLLFFISSPRFLSENNLEIAWLTFLMMPSLVFICLFGLNASLLQCQKKYFIPASAPIFFNLVWIAGALSLQGFQQDFAMRSLALVVNGATLAQLLATSFAARETLTPYLPEKTFLDLKKLGKRMSLGIVGIAATQINNAIDPLFARYADLEGPAYLWYAIRLQQYPLALFGISLSAALLPPLCRAAKAGAWDSFSTFLSYAFSKSAGLMIPLTCLIFLSSTPLVGFVYGYGAFTKESIFHTSECLQAYILGLYPATLVLIQAPAFFARGDYRTPAIGSCIAVGANIFLNAVLIFGMGLGAQSVAIATSFSALCNAMFLFYCLEKHCSLSKENLIRIGKTALASISAMGSSYWLIKLIEWPALPPFFRVSTELATMTLLFGGALACFGFLFKAKDLLFWKKV